MWNTRLDEAQAEIKIARGNTSNLRYANGTTLMAESEELKSLLTGKEKVDLKPQHSEKWDLGIWSHQFMANRWGNTGNNDRFYFQFSSVAQLCPTLCDPMNCSTPGLPVHHQLPEFTKTHVHWVGEAIQPSHPLWSPSSPALNLFQHQDLFKWISSLHQVAKVLEFSASTLVLPMNTQDWSPLGWTGWITLQSKGLSRVLSNTTVQKHQFFSAQLSLLLKSHSHLAGWGGGWAPQSLQIVTAAVKLKDACSLKENLWPI